MSVIGATGIGHLFSSASSVLRTPESLHFFPVAVPKTQTFLFSHCTPPANLVLARNVRCSPCVVTSGNQHLVGSVTNVKGLRFAVIVARFNEIITNSLLEGALEAFRQYSVKEEDITVVKVPGSFEIPIVAQKLGKSGTYDAIVCIGAVVSLVFLVFLLVRTWSRL